ncbi:hypothetical protein [Methylobacterium persicinum]|uniref:Anti-sigma factor n=1 Tax=Methylobacterium persicinum TaxID=374426 RepID=A0ABU0HQQ8_9HYPH|nr:hypothetical protein [Methylobacterium persicinum]MDQ0444669.1 hypothetical protein [Methylobacterium persicinum]
MRRQPPAKGLAGVDMTDDAARRRIGTRLASPPLLTDEDEAALQAAIAADPDAAELTDAQLARMRPARKVLPPALYAALTRRRPPDAAD